MKKDIRKKKLRIPAISHYSSRKEWERAVWKMIVRSPEALDAFTAPYERHSLVMRAAVVDRIHSGRSYREISRELWSSLQTIGSIKRALDGKNYRSYRERGKTERKKRVYSQSSHSTSRHEPQRRTTRVTGTVSLGGITRTRYPDRLK